MRSHVNGLGSNQRLLRVRVGGKRMEAEYYIL